jgi:PTH2 family peptidyl-tRNA hydrolase
METKQVIVIRKDLNMRKGKMVAQGAHASMKVLVDLMESKTIPSGGCDCCGENGLFLSADNISFKAIEAWLEGSFTKICVSVNSEKELLDVHQRAKAAGIPCSLIQDAGATEFKGIPTFTAVAIGPDLSETIDLITGETSPTGRLPLL